MTTTEISYPADGSLNLTSMLDSVKVRTDAPSLDVKVYRCLEDDIDTAAFFSTKIYAFNGIVELTGLGRLIEEELRRAGLSYDYFEVTFGVNGFPIFRALHCERLPLAGFDPRCSFLTCSDRSAVHEDTYIRLAWIDDSATATSYVVQVVGIDSSGAPCTSGRKFDIPGSGFIAHQVKDLLDYALNRGDDGDDRADMQEARYIAITMGRRQRIFFLAKDSSYLAFSFRNMFNATEFVDVPGILTVKSKYDRESAICNGLARQYDRKAERTYEVQTPALASWQVQELEQLIASRSVSLKVASAPEKWMPVLITDHTIETDNDDESLSTVKFSFRFASDRVPLTADEIARICHNGGGVFSTQFNPVFG